MLWVWCAALQQQGVARKCCIVSLVEFRDRLHREIGLDILKGEASYNFKGRAVSCLGGKMKVGGRMWSSNSEVQTRLSQLNSHAQREHDKNK